jgi:hypothetical protein
MIMRHLLNAKVAIPDQIKLAGFDDTPTASLLTVPLTTVRQPAAAIALRAVSVMNDRIAHPDLPPVHVAVHCELVVRESTVSASDIPARTLAIREDCERKGPDAPPTRPPGGIVGEGSGGAPRA